MVIIIIDIAAKPTIKQCHHGVTVDVEQGSQTAIRCGNDSIPTGSSVRWTVTAPNTYYSSSVGTCNMTQCTTIPSPYMRLPSLLATRPNATTSVLYMQVARWDGKSFFGWDGRKVSVNCYSTVHELCFLRSFCELVGWWCLEWRVRVTFLYTRAR